MLRNLVLTAAAASLAVAPVAAQAAPAARAPAPVSAEAEDLAGGSPLIAVLVFAAVSALFVVLFTNDDDDEPVSA